MAHDINEGRSGRYLAGGFMVDGAPVVTAGEFIKAAAVDDEWDVIGTGGCPVPWLCDISTDRDDAINGGITAIQGPIELVTDVYYQATGNLFVEEGPVTIKHVDLSGHTSAVITPAVSGDYINGYVKHIPSSENGDKLTINLAAMAVGKVA